MIQAKGAYGCKKFLRDSKCGVWGCSFAAVKVEGIEVIELSKTEG